MSAQDVWLRHLNAATGEELDKIGGSNGITRYEIPTREADGQYRERIRAAVTRKMGWDNDDISR